MSNKASVFGMGGMRALQNQHGRSATKHLEGKPVPDFDQQDEGSEADISDEGWADHIDPVFYER